MGQSQSIRSAKVAFNSAEHEQEATQRVMIIRQADDFDFIRKRIQELANEKLKVDPGTLKRTFDNDVVSQQILNHVTHIRRRSPGENPSS